MNLFVLKFVSNLKATENSGQNEIIAKLECKLSMKNGMWILHTGKIESIGYQPTDTFLKAICWTLFFTHFEAVQWPIGNSLTYFIIHAILPPNKCWLKGSVLIVVFAGLLVLYVWLEIPSLKRLILRSVTRKRKTKQVLGLRM